MDIQSRFATAERMLTEHRFRDAEIALRAILQENPRYLQAKYSLAIACFHLDALDEAVGLFTEVCAANLLALVSDEFRSALLRLPDYNRALAVIEQLLPLAPHTTKMIETARTVGAQTRRRRRFDA
jgi:tetratricopeptide (TPR) repeat protein